MITAITLPGSIGTIEKSYDSMGRLIHLSAPHFSQTNAFDACGRLIQSNRQDLAGLNEASFDHDALDQLLKESSEQSHDYGYDAFGNRTEHNGSTLHFDELNQISSGDEIETRYDKQGRLTYKKTPDSEFVFTYDSLDRLVTIDCPNRFSYSFRYDPLDRRISSEYKSQDRTLTQVFLYDGMSEIGAIENDKISELRIPLEGVEADIAGSYLFQLGGSFYVPTYDGERNLSGLFSLESGEALIAYRYSAFGERIDYLLQTEGNDLCPWHFNSKRSIPGTPFVAFGLRDYDTDLGRWMRPDPLGFEDGLNVYLYVHNNPLMRYDAFGLTSSTPLENILPQSDTRLFNFNSMAVSQEFHSLQSTIYLVANAWDEWWRKKDMMLALGRGLEAMPPIMDFPDLAPEPTFMDQAYSFFQSDGFHSFAQSLGREIATEAAIAGAFYLTVPYIGWAAGGIRAAYITGKVGLRAYKAKRIATRLAGIRKVSKAGSIAMHNVKHGRLGPNAAKMQRYVSSIEKYLGPGSRGFKNKAGDLILQSKNGLREVRFDYRNFNPHDRPHIHVINYLNKARKDKLIINKRIFPK
jgi:RHS repeat-associated protein